MKLRWKIILGGFLIAMTLEVLFLRLFNDDSAFRSENFPAMTAAALADLQNWHEYELDSVRVNNVLNFLKRAGSLDALTDCKVEKAAWSGGPYHSSAIWLISMPRAQYNAFVYGVIKKGAKQISPSKPVVNSKTKNDNSGLGYPAWWNPPDVESLTWFGEGVNHATYDRDRELLFLSGTE